MTRSGCGTTGNRARPVLEWRDQLALCEITCGQWFRDMDDADSIDDSADQNERSEKGAVEAVSEGQREASPRPDRQITG